MPDKGILLHLREDYNDPVRDPLWKNINLSGPLLKLISQRSVQKLARIKQLGPSYLVYPGATHTRLNHSLGVFHIAKRIMENLVSNSTEGILSLAGVKAFLCASLLHDLGHFPYAHSLKELPLKEHEVLTGEIILSKELYNPIKEELGVSPEMVAAIIDKNLPDGGDEQILLFRNLLSGVLDPDKLDYLTRDAYFCGVPYGIQDVDFIISRIKPYKKIGLSVDSQGLPAIENLLFSKYLMYKTVYWHKTVRVATAMIKKAIISGLTDEIIKENTLYGLTDEEFFLTLKQEEYEPFSLVSRVLNRNLYKILLDLPLCPGESPCPGSKDLLSRLEMEGNIARELSKHTGKKVPAHSVIIDIPEPISFEINLPVYENDRFLPFLESGSVFSGPVIEGFTRNLRKLRLLVAKEVLEDKTPPPREEMIQWLY